MGSIASTLKNLNQRLFWLGFWIGTAYFSYIFSWLWSLYPFSFLGLDGGLTAFTLAFSLLVLVVVFSALCWGFLFFSISKMWTRGPISILIAASIFTLGEYARSILFSFVMAGDNMVIGPHWTIGNPVYYLANIPFINQGVGLWGIYGLLFIFTSLIFSLFSRFRKKTLLFFLPVIFLGWYWGRLPDIEKKEVRISVIQTDHLIGRESSPGVETKDFQKKLAMVREAASLSPDYIILPEGSNFSQSLALFLSSTQAQNFFLSLSEKEINIIDNVRISGEGGIKSMGIVINTKTGIQETAEKKLLVPGGEYVPYILRPISWLWGQDVLKEALARQFVPGFKTSDSSFSPGIIFCSEIFSPAISALHNPFIVLLDSIGLFRGNNQLEDLLVRAAQMRAIENGRPLVIASNGGRSYILDQEGKIQHFTSKKGYEILTGTVMLGQGLTWYTKLRDWPILLWSIFWLLLGLFIHFNARKH